MADRPILFSAPMVRALLDGKKSQTRRVLRQQPHTRPEIEGDAGEEMAVYDGDRCYGRWPAPYRIGDRLWARETWQVPALCDPQYRATDTVRVGHWNPESGPWRSPIHMPRWASRLTLTVSEVRVQRLQEISEEDAVAEGIKVVNPAAGYYVSPAHPDGKHRFGDNAYEMFCHLWDSLNASRGYGWDANPWVAALTFTVERRNIDTSAPASGSEG